MRLLPALFAAAAVSATMAAGVVPAQAAIPQACPATFTVQHDDRIGTLRVPARPYTLTVLDPSVLTCGAAAQRFAAFLQDFDGSLPAPWTLDAATATFSAAPGAGFAIAATGSPTGGTVYPAGLRCPGTFRVLHDDRIGALLVPAGRYRVTLRPSGRPSCAYATRHLARFLSRGLPPRWSVNVTTGAFNGPAGAGFRIKAVA